MSAIAVAVITFGRPDLLAGLLDGLQRQRLDAGDSMRIVVVDNNPDGAAAAVIAAAAAAGPHPVVSDLEPQPGIPFARQRSVELCEHDDAVIFVDDDEQVTERWVATLIAAWRASGADVVTGPVRGLLPDSAPWWARASDTYDTTGTHPDGADLDKAYTNNTLVTRRVLDTVTPAFDPAFRFTGSSDLHFFLRVRRAGFRIVWCAAATVTEVVPPSRLTAAWFTRRAFRAGIGDAVSRRLIDPRPRTVMVAVAYGLARLASGMALGLVGLLPGRRAARVKAWRRVCSAAGTLSGLAGVRYQEYRR